MSEEGWKAFLAAEGVDDWVVLHGGATAVFGVGSLGEAAQLAQAIAAGPRCRRVRRAAHHPAGRAHRAADPRHVAAGAGTRGARTRRLGRRSLSRAMPTGARCRRSSSRSRRSRTRSTSVSGAPSWATHRWPMTTRSTRSGTGRRSGCRSSTRPSRSATRCTSTCPLAREQAEARLAAALAAGGRIVDDSEAPGRVDPGGPRRQQGLHRGVAGRRRQPEP